MSVSSCDHLVHGCNTGKADHDRAHAFLKCFCEHTHGRTWASGPGTAAGAPTAHPGIATSPGTAAQISRRYSQLEGEGAAGATPKAEVMLLDGREHAHDANQSLTLKANAAVYPVAVAGHLRRY